MDADASRRLFYFLSYEFNGDPEIASMRENYVKSVLKNISESYCRPMKNAWFFSTNLHAASILKEVRGYVADDDRIVLVEVGDRCGWHGLVAEDKIWLKRHL